MRVTISAAALLAFASSAFAQTSGFDPIVKPLKDENVQAGSTYEIDWTSSSKYPGTVTISLLGGASPGTLVTVSTIASGVDNSADKYLWAVDSSLGKDATYGIQITLDSDKTTFQYSFPFHIVGGSRNSTSSSSASSNGTTSATTSSKPSSSTSSAYTTMTPSGNFTATQSPTIVTSTKTASASGSGASSTTTSGPGTISTGAATHVAAGSMAMLGGLAMAVFAL